MTKPITVNDVVAHHASTLGLFWWQGKLLRIAKFGQEKIFQILEKVNSNLIQSGTKTKYLLDLQGIDSNTSKMVETYEHKVYKHRVRIQEMPSPHVIKFITTLCRMHIQMLEHGIIANDIHEGNVAETIDGFKWLDWGSFVNLNEHTAKVAFVLTSYFIHKYLLKSPVSDNEHICLNDIKGLGGPLSKMVDKDFTKVESWEELIQLVNAIPTSLEKSHWSENYSNAMDIDRPEKFGNKGINVQNLLQELDYETVTDVACNKGQYSFMAAKKAKSVIGFDIVPACIDAAQNFNEQFKLPTIFAVKTIEAIRDNKMFETDRFKSDLVIVLAIVHHIKSVISPTHFVAMLKSICNKYVLIEDIGSTEEYQSLFENNGFVLEKRLASSPEPRTLSLYRKI